MPGDDTDDNEADWYTRNFGSSRFPEEEYGYWISVTGATLGFVAVLFLLLETTARSGTPLFWTARQAAAVFAGAGFPLMVLGFVYRLPISAGVYRLAFAGVVVCLVVLAFFVSIYPDGWGVNPDSPATDLSSQVTAAYAVGLLLTVSSATILPTMTQPRKEVVEESPEESGARFELFRDVSADWRWRLRDTDGTVVTESDEGYSSEKEAEKELEGFREGVGGAPVETRDVLEERMLSEETAAVEKGEGHTKTPEIETFEEDARFEVREDEGDWRWSLRDGEGNALAASPDAYEDRGGAEASVESVREVADGASVLEAEPAFVAVYREKEGWRWGLRDGKGDELATSPDAYEDRDGIDTALERLASGEGVETETTEDGWRLVHANGEVLAVSVETYEESAEAEQAAERAKDLLAEAEATDINDAYFAVYREEGEWRWSLRGTDGRPLAASGREESEKEGYEDRDEALAAVERVRRYAPEADVGG